MEQVSEVVSGSRRGQGQLCKSDRIRGRVGERFFWIDFGPRKTGSVRDIRRKKYNSTFSTCLIVCSVKAIKGENKKRWKSKRGAALTSNQHQDQQEKQQVNHEKRECKIWGAAKMFTAPSQQVGQRKHQNSKL